MLDKLKITAPESIDISDILHKLKSKLDRPYRVIDSHYNECWVFRKDSDHCITVKSEPRLSHISGLCLEVNPSRFSSFNKLIELIDIIHPPEGFTIKRIDHAIDINKSILDLHSMIKISRKMKRSDFEFKDELTGFDIGRGNEVYAIYNKNFERVSKRKYKKISNKMDCCSRIEVRHTKNKITFNSLLSLPRYLNENPFKNIETYELLDPTEISPKHIRKRILLEQLINDSGLQSTYKNLNNNSNFNKTYMKYFKSNDLKNEIHQIYLASLSKFFKEI